MPQVLHGQWGQWARLLFAIGLFDAGLLGALCISLATSWALGEVFGWAHSLNKTVREAPWFYVAYVRDAHVGGRRLARRLRRCAEHHHDLRPGGRGHAAAGGPVFLILLLNDKPLMGEHVNTRWQNIANWSITAFVIAISTAYGVSVLFPEWFGSGH